MADVRLSKDVNARSFHMVSSCPKPNVKSEVRSVDGKGKDEEEEDDDDDDDEEDNDDDDDDDDDDKEEEDVGGGRSLRVCGRGIPDRELKPSIMNESSASPDNRSMSSSLSDSSESNGFVFSLSGWNSENLSWIVLCGCWANREDADSTRGGGVVSTGETGG